MRPIARVAVALGLGLVLGLGPSSRATAEMASLRYHAASDGTVTIQGTGGAGPDTPFALASIGKIMTAVAVLRLAADGRLPLDAAPQDYLPPEVADGLDLPDALTLRHLLTMTSGLPDYLDDAFVVDALAQGAAVQNPRVALRYTYGEAPLFQPGDGFDYSNTNYVLLGLILEQVTGQSYAQVMQDLVFRPAGMEGAFVFGSAPLPADFPQAFEDGQSVRAYYATQGMGDGGVIGSATDLARFYRALFAGDLVPAVQMSDLLHDPLGEGYGMGIEVEGALVGHSGGDLGFSSDIRLDRDSGAMAILLIADPYAETDWTYEVLGF